MIKLLLEIIDYLQFLLVSTNRHGIHSPFIYNFADKVLYAKSEENFEFIENQRLTMIQSRAKFLNTTLSHFTSNFTLSSKYCKLLHRMVLHYKPETIIEYGKNNGILLNYILTASLQSNSSIQYHYDYDSSCQEDQIKIKTLELFSENSKVELFSPWEIRNDDSKKWFIFYGTDFWENFDAAKSFIDEQSIVIISQFRQTNELFTQWKQLSNLPEVTASIELFNMGILFFRKEQPKQHFILRF